MRQRRIAEAFANLRAISGEIDAGRRRERRHHLLDHQPLDQGREQRIAGRLPDEIVSGEKPEVGKRGMAAVQEAKLHRLERRDVGDESWHPRPPTAGAQPRSDFRSPSSCTARRRPERRRSHPVVAKPRRHPRRWSPAQCDPPSCTETRRARRSTPRERDRGPRIGSHDALDRPPIMRKVVATDDVDRARTRRAPRRKTGRQHADRARRRLGMREIVGDLGVQEVECDPSPGRGSSPSR